MKFKYIASVILATSASFAGITIADDRFSLTSPNGISFSEFKGYEAWPVIG